MSIQFWLVCMIVISIVTIDGFPFLKSLTEEECRAYFASNDINKNIHAYFKCPKKLRPKQKRIESHKSKRSLMFIDDQQDNLPIFGRIKIK